MATGKETARQRMINMMYLVLTALLALQIKDSVLEKFVLIESGLDDSNVAMLDYNQRVLQEIQADVTNQGNKSGDRAVHGVAESVRKYTNGLIAYLDNLKLELGKVSTGGDTSKVYRRSTLKKYEEPSRYLVKQGFAEELKQRLDDYPQQINAAINYLDRGGMDPDWVESIAKDANSIKFYENNQEEKSKDYAHFNFYKAPLAAVLAQITFYKNQVYSKESEVLNKLKTLVGTAVSADPAKVPDLGGLEAVPPTSQDGESVTTGDDTADTPGTTPARTRKKTDIVEIKKEDFLTGRFAGIDYAQATVLSESNVVTAGLDFNARAFLTLGNSSLQPTVKLNGKEINAKDGNGVINFKTSARPNEYDENGLARKSVNIEIIADDGTGHQITRSTTHEYFVARPVIDIRSQSVEVLYLNCANNLNINVPSLGPAYQPGFKVTGGTYKRGRQKGQISVDPQQREIKIDVSSAGLFIGTRKFQAKPVPLPTFRVLPNGQAYDANAGLDERPTNLVFQLVPDQDFLERYPDDAAFLVSKGEVIISRGRTRKRSIPIEKATPRIDLTSVRNLIRPGDRIVISVEEIVRLNYKRKQIRIPYADSFTININ